MRRATKRIRTPSPRAFPTTRSPYAMAAMPLRPTRMPLPSISPSLWTDLPTTTSSLLVACWWTNHWYQEPKYIFPPGSRDELGLRRSQPPLTQSGSMANSLDYTVKGVSCAGATEGHAVQADAAVQDLSADRVISTDPPYYDNIGYADLSDYFYVWLRRSLRRIFPDLFATLAVPKTEELVATPYRHGTKEKAETFFLDGMTHGHAPTRRAGATRLSRSPSTTHSSRPRATAQTEQRTPAGTRSWRQ